MSRLLLVNTSVVILFAACLGKLICSVPSLLIKEHVINFMEKNCHFIQFNHLTAQLKKTNCILPKHKTQGFGTTGSSLPFDCISERKWGPVI